MMRIGGLYHCQGPLGMAKAMQTLAKPALDQIVGPCEALTGLGFVKVGDAETMPTQALMG